MRISHFEAINPIRIKIKGEKMSNNIISTPPAVRTDERGNRIRDNQTQSISLSMFNNPQNNNFQPGADVDFNTPPSDDDSQNNVDLEYIPVLSESGCPESPGR